MDITKEYIYNTGNEGLDILFYCHIFYTTMNKYEFINIIEDS